MKQLVKKTMVVRIVLAIIVLTILVLGVYAFLTYQKRQELLTNPTLAAQVEAEELVRAVGELMELPQNEVPTIATVSDVTKLKDQPFFDKAQNGFKVLIYPTAKKAILYDPKAEKIIDVTVLSMQPSPVASPTPVNIALYNGTTTTGLTTTIEKQLQDKGANVTVVKKTNASKSTYEKTIVIDLGGKNKAAATEIANLLGGEVASLPTGETKPEGVEILVILGQ